MENELLRYLRSSEALDPCEDIYSMAVKVYNSSLVLSLTILKRWYNAYKSIFWLSYCDNVLIGYLSAIPLSDKKFEELISNHQFDEKSIVEVDLQKEEISNFFVSSIVVDSSFRGKNVSRQLRIEFLNYALKIVQIRNDRLKVISVAGEAVNPKGEYMLQSLGLSYVKRGDNESSKLYHGVFDHDRLLRLRNALIEKMNVS